MAQPADLFINAGDLATFGKGLKRCGEILGPLAERLWVLRRATMKHTRPPGPSASNTALSILAIRN